MGDLKVPSPLPSSTFTVVAMEFQPTTTTSSLPSLFRSASSGSRSFRPRCEATRAVPAGLVPSSYLVPGTAVPGFHMPPFGAGSPGRFQDDRPAQNHFQQVPFRSDGLGGLSQWRMAFGDDGQGIVALGFQLNIFNLNATDVAVVGGIQGVGQAQDGGQLNRTLLLVGEEIAQSFVFSRG